MDWKKLGVVEERTPDPEVLICRLSGTLTSSDESYKFLEQIQHEAHKKPIRLVIDLRDVENITSAGVGIIAACFTSVKNGGGRMCLTGVVGRVRSVLQIVLLLDAIGEKTNESDAIASVRAAG